MYKVISVFKFGKKANVIIRPAIPRRGGLRSCCRSFGNTKKKEDAAMRHYAAGVEMY